MYFVPFTLMVVCTVFTVKKLISQQPSGNKQVAKNIRRNRHISIMLLLMCVAYICLTLPNRLCFSVFANQIIGHEYTDSVFLASNTLMYTRNATNVFFFYLSVSGFRRAVSKIICRRRRQIAPRVYPDAGNPRIQVAPIFTVRGPYTNGNVLHQGRAANVN